MRELRRFNGQEAIEFVLISALIFFASVITLMILGDKIGSFIQKDSAVAKSAANKTPTISTTGSQKYSVPYTTEGTVSNTPLYSTTVVDSGTNNLDGMVETTCTTEDCILDFGSFKLSNVTPDITKVIQASGASGGTEYMVSHLDEIAQQLEEQGLTEEAAQVKQLANLGHNLAAIEREAEKAINTCLSTSDHQSCVNKIWDTPVDKIDGFNYSIQPNNMKTLGDYIWGTSIGHPVTLKDLGSPTYDELKSQGQTNVYMYETMEAIKANPGIDDKMKSVIQELYWHIGAIGEDFENGIRFLKGEGSGVHDPITGGSAGIEIPSDPVSFFQNYTGSTVTHYDSALICAAGSYSDTGTACHKSLTD
jgi:hypothetical protein